MSDVEIVVPNDKPRLRQAVESLQALQNAHETVEGEMVSCGRCILCILSSPEGRKIIKASMWNPHDPD